MYPKPTKPYLTLPNLITPRNIQSQFRRVNIWQVKVRKQNKLMKEFWCLDFVLIKVLLRLNLRSQPNLNRMIIPFSDETR